MTTPEQVAHLRASNDILWENHRYRASYFVDRTYLGRELEQSWPVLHLGQPAAIAAIRNAFPATEWLLVYLWCPRDVAEVRAAARGTGDVDERMIAWDLTEAIDDALFIDTGVTTVSRSAQLIDFAAQALQRSART